MIDVWLADWSADNWLSRDGKFDAEAAGEGATEQPTRDEWLAAVREPRLLDEVPNEVQRVFEVARGAALYGYFFHPLMAVAEHQLCRAAEAAVRFKFRELDVTPPGLKNRRLAKGPSRDPRDFARMVGFLAPRGVIPKDAAASWRAIAKSWSVVAHPEDGTLFSLDAVLRSLHRFAELINGLYRI
jgi:hypothetical protein